MKEKLSPSPTALSVENVDRIFTDCMFRTRDEYNEYIENGNATIVLSLLKKGLIVCFHPERIEYHKEEVKEMLMQLPDDFFKDKGGGASFLKLCENKSNEIWTGFQTEMDKLALLGLATKQISLLLPLEENHVLPGGMPYLRVDF